MSKSRKKNRELRSSDRVATASTESRETRQTTRKKQKKKKKARIYIKGREAEKGGYCSGLPRKAVLGRVDS